LKNNALVVMPVPTPSILAAGVEVPDSKGELLPRNDAQFRQLAARRLLQERSGQTLQATALVRKTWLRLRSSRKHLWHDRALSTAVTNRQHQSQWNSQPASNGWVNFGEPISGTGSNVYLFDSTRGHEQRFYRMLTLAP
jgi:ECF sigma factor